MTNEVAPTMHPGVSSPPGKERGGDVAGGAAGGESRSALLAALRHFAATPRDGFWIDGPEGAHETRYGADWCAECVDEAVGRMNIYTPAGEYEAVANDASWPVDSCKHCAECGHVLEYSLTDSGVNDEIAHFVENPSRGTPEESYHVLEVLNAAVDGDGAALAVGVLALRSAIAFARDGGACERWPAWLVELAAEAAMGGE